VGAQRGRQDDPRTGTEGPLEIRHGRLADDSRSGFLATRPFPDVDRAMSLPTSTLRERMMNQLCKPTLTPVPAGLGSDFDDAINGGEEARRLALPD